MMKKCRNHFGFFCRARYTLGVDNNRWEKSQGAKRPEGEQNNCQNVQLQPFFLERLSYSKRTNMFSSENLKSQNLNNQLEVVQGAVLSARVRGKAGEEALVQFMQPGNKQLCYL